MDAGNKFGLRAAGVVTAIASATVIALAVPAGAHVATASPDVSCDQASVDLSSFPQTSTITFHMVQKGFREQDIAYASTIAVIFFLLIFGISMIQRFVLRKKEA